jgi:acyl-CoA synthetase (AMP-forming)/AMP-acid ligase II
MAEALAPRGATRIAAVARYWAERTPDAPALFDDDQPVSFAALARRIDAATGALRDAGVGPGDRVMIVGENSSVLIAALFGASTLGAWPVVVNARLAPREVDAVRAHCAPRLALFTTAASPEAGIHAGRWHAAEAHAPGLEGLRVARGPEGAAPEATPDADEVAALIYTSGTTGAPKGVMISHRGLLHFARVSAESRHLAPADRIYAVLPISHIFGLATMLMATLYAGASLYLRTRFDPGDVLHALAERDVSMLQGVPTMYTRILAHVRETGARVHAPRLRYVYTGGAPLDLQLKRDVESLFGQPIHHGYGLTEYAGSLFLTRIDAPRADTSSGYIVDGAELRVVDAEGRDAARAQVGELWIRGPGLMLGYYRAPDLTAEVMKPGGWYATGDLGRLDADGALFLVGRTKDLVIHSGFNVYPMEVEAVINTHPAVRLSAVVGRQAADGNEDVVAFVEAKHGAHLDVAALREYLRERLAPYKRPAEIRVLDAIPTTASGKLLKAPLREMLKTRG